jgi:hypothetical protein
MPTRLSTQPLNHSIQFHWRELNGRLTELLVAQRLRLPGGHWPLTGNDLLVLSP